MATRIYTQGLLDKRIQFQRRAETKTELDEDTGAWEAAGGRAWAHVVPVRGSEMLAGGGVQRTFDTLFVVRHSAARDAAAIEDGLRILHDGQPYTVIAAVRVDAGIDCIEIQAVRGMRDGRQL